MNRKKYIGYGVYADFDGHAIILTAEYGAQSNRIVLEPELCDALMRYVDELKRLNDQPPLPDVVVL